MGCSIQLLAVLLAYAAIVDPVYTGAVPIPPNNPATTTTAAPPTITTTAAPPTTTTTDAPQTTTATDAPQTTTTTAAPPTTASSETATLTSSNTAPPSSSSSSSGSSAAVTPTTTTTDGQATETTTSIPRTTTTQSQSAPNTATDRTLTLTRTELITIICVSAGLLVVMLIVSAVCGYCLTNVRHRRRRYRLEPYRHVDEESLDDGSLPPPKQDSSVYVQFDGIQPNSVPTGPAPPPYILPRYKPLNPYYHEQPTRTYYHHGRVSDRPYRHFREVRPTRTMDYSRWDRSVPLTPHQLPRAWI